MTTQKPTIVLVHGAWHRPEYWQPTSELLKKAGYHVHAVTLPSPGSEPPVEDFTPDVQAAREAILSALENGDVVVVAHSYGGQVASQAVEGLATRDRQAAGEKHSVVKLVYLAAFMLDVGQSMSNIVPPCPPWAEEQQGGRLTIKDPKTTFYHDVPPSMQDELSTALVHHPVSTFYSPLTYAGWRHIPSVYVIAEDEQAIPTFIEEKIADEARKVLEADGKGGEGHLEVLRVRSGHSPMASQPKWTSEVIRRAAGESV